MYLYHGGTEVIEKPEVRIANRPVDFVIDCRRGGKLFEKYDLIIGPVANDRVFRVLDFYEAGVYTKVHAINELLPYKLSNQYAFFNKDLISNLKFIKYAEVKK